MPETRRVVRVFISSTFRDMQAERDELVKRVFPQLRRLCESRGVTWGEVDLRWGITDEQAAEDGVLPICLAEIDRCRPYFIGLIGERYGWVPDSIQPELVDRYPWLTKYADRSITELEIVWGVLDPPEGVNKALFYFRDPSRRLQSREEPGSGDNSRRLEGLKSRIRAAGSTVREGYETPNRLGELVLRDMSAIIDEQFPPGSTPNALDREAALHDSFVMSRTRVYVGRSDYFVALDHFITSDDAGMIVVGEPGSGKSALLANWTLDRRGRYPDETVIAHFTGSSSQSTDLSATLWRLLGEFKRHFAIEQEIPTEPDQLTTVFANWLTIAAAHGRLVLVIDAIDQLEGSGKALDLAWLPTTPPPGVRVIVSTLAGRTHEELVGRRWAELDVQPLDARERTHLIRAYLDQYTKSLSGEIGDQIVRSTATGNPLYLRVLLEELRLFGEHERLRERVAHYLRAPSADELYQLVLARWEQDYEADTDLVGEALSLIWASRRGLSEAELLDLLGDGDQPLAHALWSPLYLAVEPALVNRSGLLGFSHRYLSDAVRDAYIPTQQHQERVHVRLAKYFEPREAGMRKLDELPWQLTRAKAWDEVADLLCDLPFLAALWDHDRFDVLAYWAAIEDHSSRRLATAYRSVTENLHDHDPSDLMNLGFLLKHAPGLQSVVKGRTATDLISIQIKLWDYLVDRYRGSDHPVYYVNALMQLALANRDAGNDDRALELLRDQERTCREGGRREGLRDSLGNQAAIRRRRGELGAALQLLTEAELITRELGDEANLAVLIGNRANILKDGGNLQAALELDKEEERLCRRFGDMSGLERSLRKQAALLKQLGDVDGSLGLLREQASVCRALGFREALVQSLHEQSQILLARGEFNAAWPILQESERLSRAYELKDSLAAALGNQAGILMHRGDFATAAKLLEEDLRILRELKATEFLPACLGNLAQATRYLGNPDVALRLHEEEESICRELGDRRGLQRSLGNRALILRERDPDGALRLLREQEEICHDLGEKVGLAASLNHQGLIRKGRGERKAAMDLFRAAAQAGDDAGDINTRVSALGNQASLLSEDVNRSREALDIAQEAYDLAIAHGFTRLGTRMAELINLIGRGTDNE
jgi:tetratricopeptide (TPR) repeat protein